MTPSTAIAIAIVIAWAASLGGAAWWGYDYRDAKVAQQIGAATAKVLVEAAS